MRDAKEALRGSPAPDDVEEEEEEEAETEAQEEDDDEEEEESLEREFGLNPQEPQFGD